MPSSGGYRRPSAPYGGYATGSPGDLSISRSSSAEALQRYRNAQAQRRPPIATGSYNGTPDWNWGSLEQRRPGPSYAGPSYAGPGYAGPGYGGGFGSAAFWAMLAAMSVSDRAAYFRRHEADPAFQQWEQQAQSDPETAARLRDLRNPAAPTPPIASPGTAAIPGQQSGAGIVWLVIFLGVAIFVLLWFMRRRAAIGASNTAVSGGPPDLFGSKSMRFRVGQTIPLDPAPFVLAAGATKVQPPPEGDMISIEAVGLVEDAGTQLHRLYLPGRTAFFQLHLGPNGEADECRYFSKLDEVQPADAAEWGEWLDPGQGMIGWPAFQTKDGKMYGRVWGQGQQRVPPRQQTETLQALDGTTQRRIQAMLYGAPTKAAPPAPGNEFVLVSAVETGGQAWVEVDAGIDINPAALKLTAVPI